MRAREAPKEKMFTFHGAGGSDHSPSNVPSQSGDLWTCHFSCQRDFAGKLSQGPEMEMTLDYRGPSVITGSSRARQEAQSQR